MTWVVVPVLEEGKDRDTWINAKEVRVLTPFRATKLPAETTSVVYSDERNEPSVIPYKYSIEVKRGVDDLASFLTGNANLTLVKLTESKTGVPVYFNSEYVVSVWTSKSVHVAVALVDVVKTYVVREAESVVQDAFRITATAPRL